MKHLVLLITALLLPFTSQAAPRSFPLDKEHTSIRFAVRYLWVSNVTGDFKKFSGTFTLDDENIANCAVALVIATNSVDTQHNPTDTRLRSENFFNVEKFPDMIFSSTSVERTGATTAKMTGNLTLRGITKTIVLDITMSKEPNAQSAKLTPTNFSAHGTLKRSDFEMDSMMWAVGDIIELNIATQAPLLATPNN